MSWYGGINYNYISDGTLATAKSDLVAIRSAGIRKVRLNIVTTTNIVNRDLWRQVTQAALDMGFHVIYGQTFGYNANSGIFNKAISSTYQAAIVAEAQWCASLNNPELEYQIGNEIERQRFITTSITQTGGLATAVTPFAHNFTNGDTVYIRNASPAAYNGAKVITVTGSTTYTFSIAGGTASPATGGNIGTTDYSDSGFVTYMKGVAGAVNAVYPYYYTYSIPTGSADAQGVFGLLSTYWATLGVADLPRFRLAQNFYEPVDSIFKAIYDEVAADFVPAQMQVTEWNLDSGGGLASCNNNQYLYVAKLWQRYNYFKAQGWEVYFYSWKDALNLFGMFNTNGKYTLAWPASIDLSPQSSNIILPTSNIPAAL